MDDIDAAAIERAKAGDSDGFRLLVDRHGRSVFRLAYRMTGNDFDAEDVVQETFLRAFRQLENYRSQSSFTTWIHRIAVNYALDLMRSRRRHETRRVLASGQDMPDPLELAKSRDPGPERALYSAEIQSRINEALESLTDQERTAFVLRHCEGMSIEEIGEVLGSAGSATKNSIFRAVRKLRAALDPVVNRYDAARNG